MWRAIKKVGTRGRTMQIVNETGGLICECDYPDHAQLIAVAPELYGLAMNLANPATDAVNLRLLAQHIVGKVESSRR